MSKRETVDAAGALVLRGEPGAQEVLVVHRPRYDDWSLPKGKVSPDEYLAVTAVREVREETGYRVRLNQRLACVTYEVNGHPKAVTWWLAHPTDNDPAGHDDETDEVAWWPVEEAIARLTYPADLSVLVEGLRTAPSSPLLIVRHTKAMPRKSWHGPDSDRRLTERGRRQAKALAGLLEAFGVGQLASSTSTRCMLSFAPYAKKTGLVVQPVPELSEESAHEDPSGVTRAMARLVGQVGSGQPPLAICGHRPVLPAMFGVLGVQPDHVLRPAEVAVLSAGGNGASEPLYIGPKL